MTLFALWFFSFSFYSEPRFVNILVWSSYSYVSMIGPEKEAEWISWAECAQCF